MNDSKDIRDAHPLIREAWPKIQELYTKITGKNLIITCSYRTPETQQKLYAQGRTTPGDIVTQIDGVNRKSNHNLYPARAIDVCVISAPIDTLKIAPLWDEYLYYPLIGIADSLELVSGGSWKHFKDFPHVEVPNEVP